MTEENAVPDKRGKFGPYGGQFVPETLMPAVEELVREYEAAKEDPDFKDEYEDLYKRALADYQNLLRQSNEEKIKFAKYANEQMLLDLLPVFDNLKLAMKHSDKELKKNPWFMGVEHVTGQFKTVLDEVGVSELKTIDQKFDHACMESIEKDETSDKKKEGMVSREIKAGYRLKDKVIAPALVAVFEYKK